MPLDIYGVLKGYPVARRLGLANSRHYHIHVVAGEEEYRASVNVESEGNTGPSILEYYIDTDFQHPLTHKLLRLSDGFTTLNRDPDGLALDYIRGNLFNPRRLKPLARSIPGKNNDLNEMIDTYVQRAISDRQSSIYIYGEPWKTQQERDVYFGFAPNRGLHNIHMNQGNLPQFSFDNGTWQDGGVLFHFPASDQWVALFLKFQTQDWHTDDTTGQRITPYDS